MSPNLSAIKSLKGANSAVMQAVDRIEQNTLFCVADFSNPV
jgi:hypothetical protein